MRSASSLTSRSRGRAQSSIRRAATLSWQTRTTCSFYNAHQEYRRALVDPKGYSCLFVGVTSDLLSELVVPMRRSNWLPRAEARCDRRTSLLLHLLVAAARSPHTDPL